MADRIRRQRENDKREKAFRKAMLRFRPRKVDFGKVVFLKAFTDRTGKGVGKRVPADYPGKVFALYVGKRGAVRAVKERGESGRPPKAFSIRTLDPGRMVGRKAEKDAVKAIITARMSRRVPPVSITKKRGRVDWFRDFQPALAKRIMQAIKLERERFNFNIRVSAVMKLPDGTVRTFDAIQADNTDSIEALLRMSVKQAINPEDIIGTFIGTKLYADFAEHIRKEGFVTTGSAMFVSKLDVNIGKDRSEWRGNDGQLWRKRNLPEVEIRRIDAEVLFVEMAMSKVDQPF